MICSHIARSFGTPRLHTGPCRYSWTHRNRKTDPAGQAQIDIDPAPPRRTAQKRRLTRESHHEHCHGITEWRKTFIGARVECGGVKAGMEGRGQSVGIYSSHSACQACNVRMDAKIMAYRKGNATYQSWGWLGGRNRGICLHPFRGPYLYRLI